MEDDNPRTEKSGKEKKKILKENAIRQKIYKFSGYAILACKVLLILFAFSILSVFIWEHILLPYSGLLLGLEFSLGFIIIFKQIRYYTYNEDEPTNEYKVSTDKNELKLLIQDLEWDIKKYEQSSMYYFSQVRIFKYLTVLLAGTSTIILGLDIEKLDIPYLNLTLDYKNFSKNTALVIGAIITSTTSLMTYWNLEKYWFTNKTIVNELRVVMDKTNMLCARGNPTDDEIKNLYNNYQTVKEKFLKYWEGALGDRGSQTTK